MAANLDPEGNACFNFQNPDQESEIHIRPKVPGFVGPLVGSICQLGLLSSIRAGVEYVRDRPRTSCV
eukprot:357933-Amorphochlora_amoeboformis.AAC.2